MKFKQVIYFVLSATAILYLQSCGSSGDKDKNSKEFKDAEESLKSSIEDLAYNIPSPTEIPYILQQTGAEFNQSLMNPNSKADQYMSRNDKAALNLGVYAADIGYLTSYDKTQEAIDYLAACKKLADNLNVIGTFDVELLKRFEDNIANKDSIAHLLDSSIKRTETFLKNDNRNRLAAQVITGSFIEGLHISTGLVQSYPKDLLPDDARNLVLTPIIQVVLNQKKSVTELRKMLKSLDSTSGIIADIMGDVEQLEKTYDALNIEEQIRNNRADLMLSDKNLVEVTEIVERIRAKVVE